MQKIDLLVEFEARAGSAKTAYEMLGVSLARYYSYRRGDVDLPAYIERSIAAHLLLPDRAFKNLAVTVSSQPR